jgi:MFS family permease
MFQVAYLICAPIVGQSLQKVGRKNMILLGYTLCIAATIGFGLCSHVPDDFIVIGKDKDGKDIKVTDNDNG